MRFGVYLPPQAEQRAMPGAVLAVRPDLHRAELHPEVRRAALRRRTRADHRRAGHQPARRWRAGRSGRRWTSASARASTSMRRRARGRGTTGCTTTCRRNCRRWSKRISRHGRARHHRSFDGRPRRADLRAAQSGALSQRVGVRADRQSD